MSRKNLGFIHDEKCAELLGISVTSFRSHHKRFIPKYGRGSSNVKLEDLLAYIESKRKEPQLQVA